MRAFSRVAGAPKRDRRGLRSAVAVVGAAALVSGLLSVPLSAEAAPSATASSVPVVNADQVAKSKYKAGTYIVTLKDAPAATYTGGISGYASTKAAKGKQLDAQAPAVTKYSTLMKARQQSLAKQVGAKTIYNYTVAYNGFAAKLTATQATRLGASADVLALTPAETLQLQESHSLEFLDVSTADGTWDQIGGVENAGDGIVVGDIDSGIAPENPSFAGDPLTATASNTIPYLVGNVVTFKKSDGQTFTSTRSADTDEWSNDDYSTKLIGAQAFSDGFAAAGDIGGHAQAEYLSPRDGSGHGSHTASTAAGNHDVEAAVEGQDFGTISGVAPAAKIAMYKACWSGPDGVEASDDDGCNTIDLLAAINQAVADGVDVINYSIGGGSATTTFSPTDAAFLNASAAGIFVAASAGNDGPGASTLDNAAPWETTVAASTIPDYEGTVVLGNGTKIAGAGISVPTSVAGPLVNSGDHVAPGKSLSDAKQCVTGSLGDVTGKIVVCDRGNNARTDKSATVAAAGGIGMVLVNVPGGADDVDNDFHSVPTVHITASNNESVHAYAATAGATATLVPDNTTGIETPVPQIAGFSSHGPVLAAGSDVLKPDIAAPGVSILAAYASAEGEAPTFNFLSGTSMAAPHITGLAAVYLGEHPNATPAEIKSAMMTGSTDLVDANGDDVTDPFTQGAGQVHPSTYLDAGFYYPADIDDWKSYIVGADQYVDYGEYVAPLDLTGVDPIDPSDLNQASIAIGDFIGSQTVTRTVTSLAPGDYTAAVDVAGVDATVTPSTLHFDAAGETESFTVTFSNETAAADEWTTGFLTWTGGDQTLRSPVALHPTTALVPASATGTGVVGSTNVSVTGGVTTALPVDIDHLMLGDVNTDTGATGDAGFYSHKVDPDTASAEFDVEPTGDDSAGVDLDLYVLYSPTDSNDLNDYTEVGMSATASGSESVTLEDPDAGFYLSYVDFYAVPGATTDIREAAYVDNAATNATDVSVSPSPLDLTVGEDSTATVSWWGLAPQSEYRGYLSYAEGIPSTTIDVSTAAGIKPASTTAPTFSGGATVSSTATATTGQWDYADSHLQFSYQWTANGAPIAGANGATYTVPVALLGKALGLVVTAKLGASGSTATAASTVVVVGGSDGSISLKNTVAPTIEGAVQAGKSVSATAGSWNVATDQLTFAYQWNADGASIAGATASTFAIPSSLFSTALTVTVTASVAGGAEAVSATSAAAVVAANDGQPSLYNTTVPDITGTALIGKTLTATAGSWNIATSDLTFGYQWTLNGSPISFANAATYKLPSGSLGKAIGVIVTAKVGSVTTSAVSTTTLVRAASTTKVKLVDPTVTTKVKAKVIVTVKADGSGKETGTVIVHYGSKTKKDVMHTADKGKITVTLPKLKKGTYKVWAEFAGNANVASDKSVKKNLKVRKG